MNPNQEGPPPPREVVPPRFPTAPITTPVVYATNPSTGTVSPVVADPSGVSYAGIATPAAGPGKIVVASAPAQPASSSESDVSFSEQNVTGLIDPNTGITYTGTLTTAGQALAAANNLASNGVLTADGAALAESGNLLVGQSTASTSGAVTGSSLPSTIIPGIPDEYVYIGGGLLLLLLISGKKKR